MGNSVIVVRERGLGGGRRWYRGDKQCFEKFLIIKQKLKTIKIILSSGQKIK